MNIDKCNLQYCFTCETNAISNETMNGELRGFPSLTSNCTSLPLKICGNVLGLISQEHSHISHNMENTVWNISSNLAFGSVFTLDIFWDGMGENVYLHFLYNHYFCQENYILKAVLAVNTVFWCHVQFWLVKEGYILAVDSLHWVHQVNFQSKRLITQTKDSWQMDVEKMSSAFKI